MKWTSSSILFGAVLLPIVACGGAPDGSADTSKTALETTTSDDAGPPGESEDAGAPGEAVDAGAPDDDGGVVSEVDAGAPVGEDAGPPVEDDAGAPFGDDDQEDASPPGSTLDAGTVVTVAPRG